MTQTVWHPLNALTCRGKAPCLWSTSRERRPIASKTGALVVRLADHLPKLPAWGKWLSYPPLATQPITSSLFSAEQDEGLSAEDKALARFQKQKLREIEGAVTLP